MSETRRQQYLQAMGIPTWEARPGFFSADAWPTQALPESPAEQIVEQTLSPVAALVSEEIEIVDIPAPEKSIPEPEIQITPAWDWNSLQQEVAQCSACELSQSRTHTVFGVGDVQAKLMVIGEAPGKDEDQQGEPFVGRAGQLLNEMLFAIGLQREQVFIANILKCRPPNNRDPRPEEVVKCESFLKRQIEWVKPKIILSVGGISAQNLLKTDEKVGRLRGQVHKYENIPLVVTYHPAYLLRSPLEKRRAWDDLKLAMQVFKGQQ
ncbi:MAG: uracil-DNA glycosylase [Gammaproteobacteria bacterium]|nr:uracil-DNA glycosylase [Gammaproteobacteria bacterium]